MPIYTQIGATFTWDEITGKPSTFPPSTHTHPLSELTQSSATNGQVATWDGTAWVPATPSSGSATTDASLLTSGTLADARLSSNVSLDNQNNAFTVGQSITAPANTSALTASYSVTGSATTPLLDLSGTWNTTGVARGIRLNVTDTASAATSALMDLGVGSRTQYALTKARQFWLYNSSPATQDASNFERGFMRWNSNTLEIGTEAGGTGTARNMSFVGGNANFAGRVSTSNGYAIGANFLFSDPLANGFRITDGSGAVMPSGGLSIYNVYSNATNNERGFVRWGSNRFQLGTASLGTGAPRSCEITFNTSASDPTSSDITAGFFAMWKNSTSGVVKLWANNAGTLVSVALA